MGFSWKCELTTVLLPRDLSSWCLATVMVTTVNASALAKRTMFHVQIFAVVVTNVKIPICQILVQHPK